MPYSKEEQIAIQQNMYGCTEETLEKSINEAQEKWMTDPAMYAMSVLSDAQEMIERGMNEQARQAINRAKYVISEKLRRKLK